jgi:o-succinylbenzoate---CoA ligase
MTETISHVALKKINGAERTDCFTALDGVSISTDERGCLMIDAPHLNISHLITNDLVRIISKKQFQWLGRYDNIINTGGIKVSAEEIERKLQPYIDVNFFIAGTADAVLGQKVTLVLESALAEGHVKAGFESVLSKYEKPRAVIALEKFKYTENGKVNKSQTLKSSGL